MKNGYRYTFIQSSTLFYEWFLEQMPDLIKDLKNLVNNGDWILAGGMVVESDTNLICGESLARQFYYGQNFFNNQFGRMARIGWLPDTFGFSAQLPQLMIKAGIEVFATHKMMWNDSTKFPLHVFNWEGLDGSSLPTQIIVAGYNTKIIFSEFLEEYERFEQKNVAPMLAAYGLGDGGGGPNEPILEWAKFIQNVPGTPAIDSKPSEQEYVSTIKNIKDKIKTYSGEMYLEKHRGVYTTNSKIKQFISSLESSLKNLELLESLLFLSGEKTKKDMDINSFWKILLKNQFHDVLPGSANYEAYQEAFHELSEITKQINIRFEAFNNLLAKHNSLGNLRFFNPTQWEFHGYIDINEMQIKDKSIKELQVIKLKIPPLSLISLSDPVKESMSHLFKVKELKSRISINNGKLQLEVDKKSLSISVKSNNGDVLLRNGNILKTYSDEPGSFDAWEIELDTLNKDNEIKFKEVKVSLSESGSPSIIGKVKLEDNSEIVQTFSLEPESEVIKVQTKIIPASRLLLFKAFFKIPNRSKEVTCSVPFGRVLRHTTKTENPMFEFPVLNWLNAESDKGEMTIISPHLHGYGYTSEGLSLTLAKFPIYPNPWSDSEGVNVSYLLYFHNDHINSNDYNRTVYQLLNPPIVTQTETTKGIIRERHNLKPRIEIQSKSSLVESIRLADSGDHLVLRIYESSGNEDKVILSLSSEVTLYETNIPETSQDRISEKPSFSHTIRLKPFEIRTLCLYPRGEKV